MDHPELNSDVRSGLAQEWSPEQIAGRLAREHPDAPDRQVTDDAEPPAGAGGRSPKSPDLPVLSGVHRRMKRVHPFISVLATLAAVPLLIGGCILGMIMKWEAERLAREDQQAHITATEGTAESGPGTNAGNVSSGQPNHAGASPTGQPNDPLQNLSVEDRFRRAVRKGTPDEVRAILKAHPDKQLTSMKVGGDGTALHLAAFRGRPGVAAVLIEFGADVNARGANDRTPLHMAWQMNRVLAVRVLLENEAETSLRDAAGYTARSLAAAFNRAAVLRVLDEHDLIQKTPE